MTFRSVLAFGIAGLLVAACAASETGEGADESVVASADALSGPTTSGATFTTTARVNLRASASTSATVLETMPLGATVSAIDGAPKAGFYEVDYKGTTGWAYGAYLKASGSGTSGSSGSSGSSTGGGGRTYSGVTVLWQGDWDYLVKCDSYSRANDAVTFYCGQAESRDFVDNGAWLAMPGDSMTRKLCNQKARVCKGSRCVTAEIVEKSETSTRWEGSTAVLAALGVTTSWKSCASSSGTATGVTITLAD